MQENSIITLNGAFACEFIISCEFAITQNKIINGALNFN